jgi:hypothetical protein
MKKLFILFIASILINSCNTKSKLSEESKFDLKKDEKLTELSFDRIDAEMFENFIFKSNDNKEKSFFVAYNDNESWNQIAEKLVKGKKYILICKYLSFEKEFQELKQNNIGTDDVPPSGNYIFYIEDTEGNVVFKNDSFEVKTRNKNNEVSNAEIDKKYIQYLNDYYPNGLGSNGEKVEIKRISEKTYWVTFAFGSGTQQEIYWLLDKNRLIPAFEFEYGGMNWESGLSYTFLNLNNKATINGTVYGGDSENQINLLKEKFINKF